MGKRDGFLVIKFEGRDIRITTHAVLRYRQRMMNIPTRRSDITPDVFDAVAREISKVMPRMIPVIRQRQTDSRVYLSDGQCVFALTSAGVIVTVLAKRENSQFADSIKEIRRSKRSEPLKENSRSRFRKVERSESRKPRQKNLSHHPEDYEHD